MVPSYGTPLKPLTKKERKALKAEHRKTPAPQPLRIGRPAPERAPEEIDKCQIHVLFEGANGPFPRHTQTITHPHIHICTPVRR